MPETKPAIPAKAAVPGNGAKVITTPSSTDTTKNGEGTEAKVTISAKEYRDLQRAKARTLSFEKRASFTKRAAPGSEANNGGDPEIAEKINAAEGRASDAERRALRAEINAGVNDILSRDEFRSLPEATKALIRKNPSMLSDADNVEEALLDIEDFCRENSIGDGQGSGNGDQGGEKGNPDDHETPVTVGGGAPDTPVAAELEDPSKLPPQERSRAVLRNVLRKAKGVK